MDDFCCQNHDGSCGLHNCALIATPIERINVNFQEEKNEPKQTKWFFFLSRQIFQ